MNPDQLLKAGEVYAALAECQHQMDTIKSESALPCMKAMAATTIGRLLENSLEVFYDIMVAKPDDPFEDAAKIICAMRGEESK